MEVREESHVADGHYKDKWNLILSEKRTCEKGEMTDPDGGNPFEDDYGRLITSAPVRRLQNKTQIFPLERSTYIRTRLTHSLEVSYIAGLLGQKVELFLRERGDMPEGKSGWLCSLLRTAGLVHDMGNPPFGHFGEEAVKDFFRTYLKNDAQGLSELERADLENFDGNVQSFRILTKLHYLGDAAGYNLNYSTLAALIKYPCNALEGNLGASTKEIAHKKFGYFASEANLFQALSDYLQMQGRRCPLAYLLEAADDIAYCTSDLEDGVKLGAVRVNQIYEFFDQELTEYHDYVMNNLDGILEKYKNEGKLKDAILTQNICTFLQREMISATVRCFVENYDSIMRGTLEHELLEVSAAGDIRKVLRQLQLQMFRYKAKEKKELAGWEAMHSLLGIFVRCCEEEHLDTTANTYAAHIYNIISANFRQNYETLETYPNDRYNRLRMVVDFLTSLNDRDAIDLFKELKGATV